MNNITTLTAPEYPNGIFDEFEETNDCFKQLQHSNQLELRLEINKLIRNDTNDYDQTHDIKNKDLAIPLKTYGNL